MSWTQSRHPKPGAAKQSKDISELSTFLTAAETFLFCHVVFATIFYLTSVNSVVSLFSSFFDGYAWKDNELHFYLHSLIEWLNFTDIKTFRMLAYSVVWLKEPLKLCLKIFLGSEHPSNCLATHLTTTYCYLALWWCNKFSVHKKFGLILRINDFLWSCLSTKSA